MKTKTKAIIVIFGILILIQFINNRPENKEVNPSDDFITMVEANQEVKDLLLTNCYDCHSNQTSYPSYANFAPLSWWINHHVDEGREELNFSEFGSFSYERKEHKIEECIELLEEGEMPLASYELMHGELSEKDKEVLIQFFKDLKF